MNHTYIYMNIIWKSDLSDRLKRNFFQAVVLSITLYTCTIWTLTKRILEKFYKNCTRTLRAILNKSWKLHPTKQQLYGLLPPIPKNIQIRRTIHAGNWKSSKEKM